jgi:hypothetical protein
MEKYYFFEVFGQIDFDYGLLYYKIFKNRKKLFLDIKKELKIKEKDNYFVFGLKSNKKSYIEHTIY